MTLQHLLGDLVARLQQAGVEAPRSEAWLLLGAVTGRPRAALIASGVPVGLGEPVFDKLEAEIARGLMSINAVKGGEFGDGGQESALQPPACQHGDRSGHPHAAQPVRSGVRGGG